MKRVGEAQRGKEGRQFVYESLCIIHQVVTRLQIPSKLYLTNIMFPIASSPNSHDIAKAFQNRLAHKISLFQGEDSQTLLHHGTQ